MATVERMDATTFAALGEPRRLEIVELLRGGPSSVNAIAGVLGLRQPQTSKHLGVLRTAGVVEVVPMARRRIYHLRSEPFTEIGEWLDSFEQVWDARLDQLASFLATQHLTTADDDGRSDPSAG